MGKHHVKNGPARPKNGPPPKPRSDSSDPSNDEYITLLKKVTFDSLVEFSPHELNSCPLVTFVSPFQFYWCQVRGGDSCPESGSVCG